jgi:hypothetical protein
MIISQLSVSEEEYTAIKSLASAARLPLTSYIIAAALNPERFADLKSNMTKQSVAASNLT